MARKNVCSSLFVGVGVPFQLELAVSDTSNDAYTKTKELHGWKFGCPAITECIPISVCE
jgi:hypothetical protein